MPTPKDHSETPLHKIRGTMPDIIVGDDFVGVSPMVGPTPETWELIRQLSAQKDNPDVP